MLLPSGQSVKQHAGWYLKIQPKKDGTCREQKDTPHRLLLKYNVQKAPNACQQHQHTRQPELHTAGFSLPHTSQHVTTHHSSAHTGVSCTS